VNLDLEIPSISDGLLGGDFPLPGFPSLVCDEPEYWHLILGLRIVVHFALLSSFSRTSGYFERREGRGRELANFKGKHLYIFISRRSDINWSNKN